jgi:hypothetical protein
MSNPTKNYKIIVDSKHFGNMKGISPAEVAKKAAGKILGLSNNKITKFSMVETKNGKIRNYKAFKENLIRPYHKNGKLIKCRIIVKKIGKHTGGGEAEKLSNIYNKPEFNEEDKKKIKDEMVIINNSTNVSDNYYPYNLTKNIEELAGDIIGLRNLVLGANDPIRHFFKNYSIEIDVDEYGWMKMSYEDYEVNYDFTGDENSFSLNIYNLDNAIDIDTEEFKQNCNKYVEFLKKIYTEAKISIDYGSKGSNSNGSSSNGSSSNGSSSNGSSSKGSNSNGSNSNGSNSNGSRSNSSNGLRSNGSNGLRSNGLRSNGSSSKGSNSNGSSSNGLRSNGLRSNGSNYY